MSEQIIEIENGGTKSFTVNDDSNDSETANVQPDALGGALVREAVEVVSNLVGFEGRRLITIKNITGSTIKYRFNKKEENLLQNSVTNFKSIKPVDGIVTTNYWCDVWLGDKHVKFPAYGHEMARCNNVFEFTPEGIVVKANEQIKEDRLIALWHTD